MRVLVTGGRNYADRARVFRVLDEIDAVTPIDMILHGACGWNGDEPAEFHDYNLTGADGWAHEWARTHHVAVLALAAKWTTQGRAAGPIRNANLLSCGVDLVVAFTGSTGTANMVSKARAAGVPVRDER